MEKFIETIRSLQLLIQKDISLIRGKLVFRMTEVGDMMSSCLKKENHSANKRYVFYVYLLLLRVGYLTQ